jgi:ABC-type transport system substrate-binding protein
MLSIEQRRRRRHHLNGVLTQQIPTSLDPFTDSATTAAWNSAPVHDWLEYYDSDGTMYPSLAETVEQVTPSKIRYTLRSGVSFQSGTPVSSTAVRDLFEWVKDKANGSWLQSRLSVATIEVIDDLTFEIVLTNPDSAFRSILPRLPIVDVATMGEQKNSPSGCGPFKFAKWTKGYSVEYTKDDKHRNAKDISIDRISIRHYADPNAGTTAFTSGKQHWCYPVSLSQIPALREQADAGAFELYSLEQGVTYLAINNKTAGLDDPRVRKAMRLAVDRAKMVASAFNGIGQPYFALIPPSSEFYDSGLEYDQSVDEAKQLLADAGVSLPPMDILSPNVDYFQALATILKENLAAIGVTTSVKVEDTASVIDRAFNTKDFDLLVLGDSLEPEVSTNLDFYIKSDGPRNVGQYANPEVDALLAQGRAEIDPAARKEVYQQAMQIAFVDDTAMVPLVTEGQALVTRNSNMQDVMSGGVSYWKFQAAKVTGS